MEMSKFSGDADMNTTDFQNIRARFQRLLMIAPAVALLICVPARASLIVTVGNVSSSSPASSNALEIDLINTGPAAVTLGGFSFETEVTDANIIFTSATTATIAPYVFAGSSLFGPTISTSAPGQTLDAFDLWAGPGGGASIAAGATVGLGRAFFSVLAGALSGPVTVTLSPFPATSLADASGGNISVSALTNGSITIAGSSVPEPSSLVLAVLALAALTSIRKRF